MQPFDAVVMNMMRRFGGVATLETQTIGTYDPSTSDATNTTNQYSVNFLLFDYTNKNMGDKSNTGAIILAGDKQCFVQPTNKVAGGVAMPEVLANRDSIIINNVRWKILTAKAVNTSAADAVLYEYHLRK